MQEKKIIVANWKMNKTKQEALAFLKGLISSFQAKSLIDSLPEIYLAVPFTLIQPLSEVAAEYSFIKIGAQNMNDASEGAFTGEIAAKMLIDAGAQFVLLGHSERRSLYNEDDAFINRKVKRAILDGIQPILCIGETLKDYEEEQTEVVLERQLFQGLQDLNSKQIENLIVAYEPVWAIGTGKSAHLPVIDSAFQCIRKIFTTLYNESFSDAVKILYGGSVNTQNAQDFLKETTVNGLLIGGASLSLETFCEIIDDSRATLTSQNGDS